MDRVKETGREWAALSSGSRVTVGSDPSHTHFGCREGICTHTHTHTHTHREGICTHTHTHTHTHTDMYTYTHILTHILTHTYTHIHTHTHTLYHGPQTGTPTHTPTSAHTHTHTHTHTLAADSSSSSVWFREKLQCKQRALSSLDSDTSDAEWTELIAWTKSVGGGCGQIDLRGRGGCERSSGVNR